MGNGYLRQPCIRGDTVVFVCDDDLWQADVAGGVARRLTAGLGEVGTPGLSPDGRWLAYVGRDEQHPEVYLMSAGGGPARRMTWLGPDVMVRGWTPEGSIVFVTIWGQPFFRNYRAFTLPVEGGVPELLPFGQVDHLAFGPAGAMAIGRNTTDPARWKRYRGGRTGALWVRPGTDGEFRRLAVLQGNLTAPMWLGERIFYLSDHEGVGNLYSCLPDGTDVRRHTDHEDFYARNAATDGKRIIYQCAAALWLYDPVDDRTRKLEIEVRAHRTQAARKFVPAADFLGGYELHPAGHSIAVDARGKLFSFALWEGAVRQYGPPDCLRYRQPRWLGDGSLAAVCDASGAERVRIYANGEERVLDADIGRAVAMEASPRGRQLAIANHRNEVLIADLETNRVRTIARSEDGRTEHLAWSPDGKWLAYQFCGAPRTSAIHLYELASGNVVPATSGDFWDYCPSFDPLGRYLYFLSVRTFDPVYDSVQFELSFPRASRPYLLALQAHGRPPFEPEPRGFGKDEAKASTDDLPAIEADGLQQRVAGFPVAEGVYRQIAGIEGKVLWTVFEPAGAHGRGGLGGERPGKLECFDLADARKETLLEKVHSFGVSRDGRALAVREGKKLRVLEAGKKPDPKAAEGHPEHSRQASWIDLGRIRIAVDPVLEWRQMLGEVARLQRENFWVEDMSGVDWDGVVRRYQALLPLVSTRGELSDLIWEMQGELGTSHAYEMAGDYRKPPEVGLGFLAADLRYDPKVGGDEITRIAIGDAWEAQSDSPLNAVGVEARIGERIVAVNGQPVTRERPAVSHFVNQWGAKAELTLSDDKGARRVALVTLLKDEVPARYRDWVEANRRWVHERSNGRAGYLHLPDMMSPGFAEFHRYFPVECEREALIIDLRYNRGGHVSQLLLEKLARKRIGYKFLRWDRPYPYPRDSAFGAIVALANEHSGSDGDIFSHAFKLMRIGPLVGKRTWGGVIGIWPRHQLVDGTTTTQPEAASWFTDVGWSVENYGTDPDIDIDNAPHDYAAGRDRQLETALEVALRRADEVKPTRPAPSERPRLAPPPLPPRR